LTCLLEYYYYHYPGTISNIRGYKIETPLHIACKNGFIEAVELLLARDDAHFAPDNCSQATPLHNAVIWGHMEIVGRLLKDPRVDINATDALNRTALYRAVTKHQTEIVKLLLSEKNIKVDETANNNICCKNTPFYVACESGFVDLVQIFLEDERTNVNHSNTQGVTGFLASSKAEVLQLLLGDERVQVNTTDSAGVCMFELSTNTELE